MSGLRKVSVATLIVGCISLLGAPAAVILPGFLTSRAMHDVSHEATPLIFITSGFIYLPIALALGLFGLSAIAVSIWIYTEARRKEAQADLTRRCS